MIGNTPHISRLESVIVGYDNGSNAHAVSYSKDMSAVMTVQGRCDFLKKDIDSCVNKGHPLNS